MPVPRPHRLFFLVYVLLRELGDPNPVLPHRLLCSQHHSVRHRRYRLILCRVRQAYVHLHRSGLQVGQDQKGGGHVGTHEPVLVP